MKLFVKCQRNGGDWFAQYEGMEQETVTTLLDGLGCSDIEFLSENDWIAAQPTETP